MKILVVEDEHKIAHALKKGLEQENFSVDLAYDGQQGLDMALNAGYDVIVLDLMLPEIDGLTVCQQLRDQKVHTPILMLTAKGTLSDKVTGLNAGADDYLVRPFAFEELLARIKALTRRPHQDSPMILSAGNLSLNILTYETSRAGQKLTLSKKEFALLEYFLRHTGRILSKQQLIDHLWPYESDVLPNTVEVYIGYLRNKIDRAFPKEKPLIHTVRGFGYKIDK